MPWSLRIVVGGYDDVRDVSKEGSTTCAQPLTRCTVIKEWRRICVKLDVMTLKSILGAVFSRALKGSFGAALGTTSSNSSIESVCSSPGSPTKASKSSSLYQ